MGVGIWMMCLLEAGLFSCCCWTWGPGLDGRGGPGGSGERRSPLLDSEMSEGEGVFGGVSMDGMGWSLKQADS